MTPAFTDSIAAITSWLGDRALTPELQAELEARFPAKGEVFQALADSCRQGVAEGWLAQRGDPDLRWGRPVKPGPDTQNYSVDVVEMTEVAGPHHAHPNGEIDMIVPIDPDAKFDGHGEGWLVYPPGSAHCPTVRGGKAIVLYLLPAGEIAFTPAT
jgi:hypothetical protein